MPTMPALLAPPPRRVKSGRGSGTIGQLTGGLVTRQAYYEHAALMALLPLINPQLYPEFDLSLLPGLDGQQAGAAQAAAHGTQ